MFFSENKTNNQCFVAKLKKMFFAKFDFKFVAFLFKIKISTSI